MKEYPIIFSPEMVKAILEGRKSVTRRVIKPQPDENGVGYMKHAPLLWDSIFREPWSPWKWDTEEGERIYKNCHYGEPGDVLWVRENWTQNGLNYYRYQADWLDTKPGESNGTFTNPSVPEKFRGKWKPSIHMPRVAARILLRVTDVRVERLQDICANDAIAEGIETYTHANGDIVYNCYQCDDKGHIGGQNMCDDGGFKNHLLSFASLWTNINGYESWNSNPWVWVVAFEVIK